MSGEVKILGDELQHYSHSDPDPLRMPLTEALVSNLAWSPDSHRLASLALGSREMILWDVQAGRRTAALPLNGPLMGSNRFLTFISNGNTILSVSEVEPQDSSPECLSLIDGRTGDNVRHLTCPSIGLRPFKLNLVASSPEGSHVAMLFNSFWPVPEQMLSVFDGQSWPPSEVIFTLTGLRAPEYEHDMAISPDGLHIALLKTIRKEVSGKNGGAAYPGKIPGLVIFDVTKRKQALAIDINEGATSQWASVVRYSPDGKKIAVGLDNGYARPVRIFDGKTGDLIASYELAKNEKGEAPWWAIKDLDWSPDGKFIAAGGESHSLRILDTVSPAIATSVPTDGPCWSVAYSPDGTKLAYGSGHTVTIRSVSTAY